MRNIDLIRDTASAAQGRWRAVLAQLGITVPDNARQHAPCPACGGKDRFRFDDDGRGAHFCNQCGAGDGLELVQKVRQCDITAAARLVAEVVGTLPASSVAAPAEAPAAKRQRFLQRYQALARQAVPGVSVYLAGKGLAATYPLLPDGRLLLA
ncbi:DNA primase, partial [Dickeya sp. CFBP 2040]|uniref:primase-helicase zinc-binding domain-containing protein n=1 Tax=Dickeya sp. CFBP 2040 TaxID=2718531 RepID=UPI0016AE29BD